MTIAFTMNSIILEQPPSRYEKSLETRWLVETYSGVAVVSQKTWWNPILYHVDSCAFPNIGNRLKAMTFMQRRKLIVLKHDNIEESLN